MSYAQNNYASYGGNPYTNGPDAEAGYGGNQQGHLAQPNLEHELSNYSGTSNYSQATPGASAPHTSTVLTQQDFLARVEYVKSEISALGKHIAQISNLHQTSLNSADQNSSAALESLVTQTQLKNTQIRDQIKYLEGDTLKTQDSTKKIKTRQSKQLKDQFTAALKDYQQEEVGYRQRYRDQIARQYRIVNPEATDAEVREASDMDWGSEGVFQTALKSNRTGQASSVLGAVRARHNELQRIEGTLNDLAAMFADLAQIVEAQDPVIEHTEQNAMQTAEDVNKGNTEIDKANEHARRRRRNKWWCLLIVVLIVLAIALGIGLGIGLQQTDKKTVTS